MNSKNQYNFELNDIKSQFYNGNKASKCEEIWIKEFAPTKISELAANKSKISELIKKIEVATTSTKPSILLLSGPTGCGKTTTFKVICDDLKIEIIEWCNNSNQNTEISTYELHEASNFIHSESQYSKFLDFILHANRYSNLQIFKNSSKVTYLKKIVLVKDFPNVILSNRDKLSDFVSKYYLFQSAVPLVLIISDNQNVFKEIRNFFSPSNIKLFNLQCIKFNSITQTYMQKSINNIINKISLKTNINIKDSDILENIIASSQGDIRAAINSLQFYFNKSSEINVIKIPSKYIKKSKKCSKLGEINPKKVKGFKMLSQMKTSRDSNISLFKLIGKILHYKREEINVLELDPSSHTENLHNHISRAESPSSHLTCAKDLPNHLNHANRSRLTLDVDNLLFRSQLSSEVFLTFLHGNYPQFFHSIDDLAVASTYLADAENLLRTESFSDNFKDFEYSNIISARAILFCKTLKNDFQGPGWCPLHKPKNVAVETGKISAEIKSTFTVRGLTVSSYVAQYLPYATIIGKKFNSTNEKQLLKEITKFTRTNNSSDKLLFNDEDVDDDFIMDYENDEVNNNENSTIRSTNFKSCFEFHDDLEIEDFDN